MTDLGRRGILKMLGTVPVAGLALSPTEALAAHEEATKGAAAAAKKGQPFAPKFFTAHEWATVRLLVDLVIPKDERSGSATDALVPEFMDFAMTDPLIGERDREYRQTAMRGGLAWLDLECQDRFGRTFLEASESERTQVLDDIAYPEKVKGKAELKPGVRFFTSFRDLTATGFWSSKMGVEDLQYVGNTYVAEWKGPPAEVLKKLGLS
jgi:gluconate 2-dehydrogenase gamma chain